MPSQVLLCPPTYFEVRDRKNPYMRLPVDPDLAQQQWERLCATLHRAGLQVNLIDPVQDLEDMVFAANQVFVGCHEQMGKFIVPSEMRFPSRQKEVSHYVDWFASREYEVIALELRGEYLEGGGDLLWHPDRSRVWAGYGIRSSEGGLKRFTSAMGKMQISVSSLHLVDEYFYHLDTCLSPLNAEAAIFYPGAFSSQAQEQLKGGWKRLYPIGREEALRFACNGIAVNGRYITSRLTKTLESVLREEQLDPVVIDVSEFEKSGGSVFCMKTFLD
jgi:N-dimethylarginine dimethylaminohydrolase